MNNSPNRDSLNLATNKACRKMLAKLGENWPNEEKVKLSRLLIKVNKRGREQSRVLLITDKAVYNLMPRDYAKCKRRIRLEAIAAVTFSETNSEFALHVPEEYDYRYKSNHREPIKQVLKQVFLTKTGHSLRINTQTGTLNNVTVTKDAARMQTREDQMRRKRELLAQISVEDEVASSSDPVVMMEGDEDVSLDDFEMLKVIGRGSFGKVMQVRKKGADGTIYAMKILKKKAIIQRNQVEHTLAERKILEALKHPFLMTLRYAFQTATKLYFVLDYYTGGELFFHLKKKRRFDEGEARIIVAEVALALGHLHSLDVIYRDLKPENVLLDDFGHACLTDFGLSKDLGPDSQTTKTFCGTPEYLAPEIVLNRGHSKPVDWWALGILLYELCVGIPPFYSQNVSEMYRLIREAPLRFSPSLSSPIRQVIAGLLKRDPKRRLGSGPRDVDEIKEQPFFADNIDWDLLYRKEIQPPYRPVVKNGDMDTDNFDTQFTNEPVVDSYVQSSNLGGAEFNGFTFAPDKNLG